MTFKSIGMIALLILSLALNVSSSDDHDDINYCRKKFNVSDDEYKVIAKNNQVPDTDKMNKMTFCQLQQLGLLTPAGAINYDTSKWELNPSLSKYLKDCPKKAEGQPQEKWGRLITNCMMEEEVKHMADILKDMKIPVDLEDSDEE